MPFVFRCLMDHIRNFSIIAHIDHGKSHAGRPPDRAHRRPVRRARWRRRCSTPWTSSASAASPSRRRPRRCAYKARDGREYELNLIDTPGPRGLLLRGLALALGLRRRAAGGRRLPGRGGADGGQLLHRHRARRRGGAGAEQDRPAVGAARARDPGDRGRDRHPRARRDPLQRQDGRGHRRRARGRDRAHPAARGRSRRRR